MKWAVGALWAVGIMGRRSNGLQGRFQDFKLGGGGTHCKKIAPSGGKREIVGVFRVKNHDFTPKNHIFSNFRGGGGAPGAPPTGSAPGLSVNNGLSE